MAEPASLQTPGGPLEWASYGGGRPATVFAHGLGQSIETTRPFASGVRGRRVFFQFRGHGASAPLPQDWTYADLAADLRAAADEARATAALGVSMGAGALCALLAEDPGRFERIVLVLPAALDAPREAPLLARADALAALVAAGDAPNLALALAQEQAAAPEAAPAVAQWAAGHARWLLATRPVRALREMPRQIPVPDAAPLAAVTAPALVIAQEDDPVHPVAVARRLAAALGRAELVVFPPGGLLWAHRATLRRSVGEFLTGGDSGEPKGPAK